MSVVAIVALVLSVVSNVLHAVKPLLKNRVVDAASEVVDEVQAVVPLTGGGVAGGAPPAGDPKGN